MAQFTLAWNNTDILASVNNINQRVSYRQRSVGGSWLTSGFTPPNDLDKTVNDVISPVLDDNIVWQFKVDSLCTSNGPVGNTNGIRDSIGFACIDPDLVNTNKTSAIGVDLTGTDIIAARFTLRRLSDGVVVFGPLKVTRSGNMASTVASALTPATSYYWEIELFATLNGVDVVSSASNYLNSVCGPYAFDTENSPVANLVWIADQMACEKEGGFGTEKVIPNVSSPAHSWYDETTGRVYIADHDDTNGNVYWFDPITAAGSGDMNHSLAITSGVMYNARIDGEKRKIYFVGQDSDGLTVYDIDTDTVSIVPFGSNFAFSRILLTVTPNYIYCNDSTNSIIIIDRDTLTIVATKVISTLTNPAHFNQSVQIVAGPAGKIYVLNYNNTGISTIGVYSDDLNTHITEITLPGAATWIGGGGSFWQTGYYDTVSLKLYVGDTGSSKKYIINTSSDTVISSSVVGNKGGKSNVLSLWTTNPITGDLLYLYSAQNTPSDTIPIKRTYLENRTTGLHLKMYENQAYVGLSHITGTSKLVGVNPGTPFWEGQPGYDTDGSITILNNTISGINTGLLVVNTLKEVDSNNSNTPNGNTKSNLIGDPDYISPSTNLTVCPLTYSTDCPADSVTTFNGTTLEYEFSLASNVKANPAIAKIQVYALNINTNSTEGAPIELVAPFTSHYYSGQFTSLGGTNYTIRIKYLNSLNVEIQTC